jgi:hypothetical protein
MKKYNWIPVIALAFLCACQTNANNYAAWKADGSVLTTGGKKIQLDIQGIYDSLDYAGDAYLAGFKIDEEGSNSPTIARVNNTTAAVTYWPFEGIPNDIFVHEEKAHAIITDGQVYMLQGEQWELTAKRYPRESQIIYSDHKKELVICHPASAEKTGDPASGCFSVHKGWQLNVVWVSVVPRVCNGNLYIVEERGMSKEWKNVSLVTGKVLESSPIKNVPEDLCRLKNE